MPTKRLNVLLCGKPGTGKTSLLYRLAQRTEVNPVPTFGFHIETVRKRRLLNGQRIEAAIWDIGGADRLKPSVKHYTTDRDVVALAVDLSNARSIQDSIEYFKGCESLSEPERCIVVFTKSDVAYENSAMPEPSELENLTTQVMEVAGIPIGKRKGHVVTSSTSDVSDQSVLEHLVGREPVLEQIIARFKDRVVTGEDKTKLQDLTKLRENPNLKYADIKAVTDRRTYRHSHNRFTQFFAKAGTTSSTKHLKQLVSQANRDTAILSK